MRNKKGPVLFLAAIVLVAVCIFSMLRTGQSQDVESAWEDIQERGYINIGVTTDSNYKREMLSKISKEIGIEIRTNLVTSEEKKDKLKDEKVDCILGGYTAVDDIEFSNSILEVDEKAVILRSNRDWLDESDNYYEALADKTFAAAVETKAHRAFEAVDEWRDSDLINTETSGQAIKYVLSGEADVAIVPIDKKINSNVLMKVDDMELQYRLTFAYNEDSDIGKHLNDAIRKLKDDGTVDDIIRKYKLNSDK